VHGVERAAHLVHRPAEALPLLGEPRQGGDDLVGGALHGEGVDGLADHRQQREQRERGAAHDLAGQGVVEQLGIVLVDEGVDALVRDEAQHVVDGAAGGVDVATGGQLVDPLPHVPQERRAVGRRLVLARGLEAAQVGGHGNFTSMWRRSPWGRKKVTSGTVPRASGRCFT
jgi:hypothetical protein